MTDSITTTDIDPATIEVVRNYFASAGEEMHNTLVRTAYNTIIYEILDFGITLYDKDLNLIADSPGLSMFLGANDFGIEKGVERIGEENLDPGDIIFLNYPYWSSGHVFDVLLFAPYFMNGEIIGYGAIRAHWLDLGAKDDAYILDSTDVHQEGLVMPGVKIYKGGEPDEELHDILRFNSRLPNKVIGDLNAQVAALRVGERRMTEVFEKYGQDTVEECIDQILHHGEKTVREKLRELPDGTWYAEDFVDDDGITDELVKIGVEVTIDGDEFTVDFSPSADETEGPINVPLGVTQTTAKLVLKILTTPQESPNGGHYRASNVVAPEGNLFHASYPAPTFTLWPAMHAIDVIFKALSNGIPERIAASSGADLISLMIYGEHPESGQRFVEATDEGVGWGAFTGHDGEHALMHISESRVKNIPTEVFEHKVPMIVERYALRQDSGGVGEYRGGIGAEREYRFTAPVGALTVCKNAKTKRWGAEGGEAGAKHDMVWFPDSEKELHVGTHRDEFEAGEKIFIKAGGGGGYGDPHDRDPERVREDVKNGYVSREAAREEYGVAIAEDGDINWDETESLRS
jgi:N-methylhydantoinase B